MEPIDCRPQTAWGADPRRRVPMNCQFKIRLPVDRAEVLTKIPKSCDNGVRQGPVNAQQQSNGELHQLFEVVGDVLATALRLALAILERHAEFSERLEIVIECRRADTLMKTELGKQ